MGNQDLGAKVASEVIIYSKYSRYLPAHKRRETWQEVVERYKKMMIKKYPKLESMIEICCRGVLNKEVLPSMRMLQFAGAAVEVNNARGYNCSFTHASKLRFFKNLMFLLLGGTGVGYSVQKHHVDLLPPIKKPTKQRKWVVGDSIIGWADSINGLMRAFLEGKPLPKFDYSDVREKGTLLVTAGGKAPGPAPLRICHDKILGLLEGLPDGHKLTTWQVSDIACFIADAVLAGGIRRAAMIALFDADDLYMQNYKAGNWWESHPERARVNISAMLSRQTTTEEQFRGLFKATEESGAGEPGVLWSSDIEEGTNPSLRKGTEVVTYSGVFPIEELEGKSFEVPNLDGEWSNARCWLSGKDVSLYSVKLDTGKTYFCSPEHKWPVFVNGRFIKVEAKELKDNDLLPINTFSRKTLFKKGGIGDYEDGLLAGWLYGDGCLTTRSDTGKLVASFIVGFEDGEDVKDRLLNKIEKIDGVRRKTYSRTKAWEWQVGSPLFVDWVSEMGLAKKSEGIPKKLWTEWSEETIRGFVDGLVSSDGHVAEDSHGVSLSSSQEKLAKDFQTLLGLYGIKSKLTLRKQKNIRFPNGLGDPNREYLCYTVRTTVTGRAKFSKLFSLTVKHKAKRLEKIMNTIEEFAKVVSVNLTNIKEDVWDIAVYDNTHCFQLGQVTTGNCAEIALRADEFCNLTTINFSTVRDQEDLVHRAHMASFLGTLQAGFTDFHYLNHEWGDNCLEEALLGISMTGIGDRSDYRNFDLKEACNVALETNEFYAKEIGINKAARVTCLKPEGTASLVLGTASGVHGRHAPFYVRRSRFKSNEPVIIYLASKFPNLVVKDKHDPDTLILELPQKSPSGSIMRQESALETLERAQYFHREWVVPGHRSGANRHNVSVTVSVKPEEWKAVGDWMWENREGYNGISVLPYDGGTYVQAPFEEITEEQYKEMLAQLNQVDLSEVLEEEDGTTMSSEIACAGGQCEI